MKAFQFRLATVKRLRDKEHEEAERKVIEQEHVLQSEQLRLKSLHEDKAGNRQLVFAYMRDMDLFMAELARKFEVGIDLAISAQQLKVQEAYQELQKRKQQLNDALREKKIFEKLEEKAHKAYKKERLKHEQKFLDELAGIGMHKRATSVR